MTADKGPVIHIGYPKCGSSFLQHQLFGQHPGIQQPWSTDSNRIIEEICWPSDVAFDPAAVASRFDDSADDHDGLRVISHETLIGDPIAHRYWGERGATRLAKVFPEARVLIIIRRHDRWIASAYMEYVRRGGTLSFGDYFSDTSESPGYRSRLPAEYLLFHQIVALYKKLFGEERVCVLPLELMQQDPDRFFKDLYGFLDLDPIRHDAEERIYPGLTKRQLHAELFFNRVERLFGMRRGPHFEGIRFFVRHNLGKITSKASFVPDAAALEVLARIAREDTEQLQKLVAYDLSELGYQ